MMNKKISIRPITSDDENVLWQMLYFAAHMDEDENRTVDDARIDPFLRRYVDQWGQPDDLGFIADMKSKAVGAVWVRQFEETDFPELAIAVLPAMIGKGIGTQLMTHMINEGKGTLSGISLSVRANNPAYDLYKRMGFKKTGEIVNRVGTTSYEMVLVF